MKLFVVTGSREFSDQDLVETWAEALPEDALLMEGEARGVDRWARNGFLRTHDESKLLPRPAMWDKYGKKAGLLRNDDMAREAQSLQFNGAEVAAQAFWDGVSTGTPDCVRKLRGCGIKVTVTKRANKEVK